MDVFQEYGNPVLPTIRQGWFEGEIKRARGTEKILKEMKSGCQKQSRCDINF